MLYDWIISLPMMICLFWVLFFGVRLFRGDDEPRVKITILLFYIASTILYTNHWLYFSNAETTIGAWAYIIANLSVYPLYYSYLLALTRTHSAYELVILFIPAFAIAVFFPLNQYYSWTEQKYILIVARICFAIQVIWVWIRGFQLLRDTQRRMDNTYTDDRSYLLQPSHLLLLLISITAFFSMLLNMLGRDVFDGSLLVAIPAIMMSVLLFSLGYVAAHTTLPQETVVPEEVEQEDRATTAETDELMYKIATVLREKQLFADSHLTIQDLASAVCSNRTYVSNCINRRTGLSFSQYVARYRIEHAKQILQNPKYTSDHEAIADAIALSGFSTEQNFYRVFKEIAGVTPLRYRQQNKSKA